ncbi:TolC family protein [Comamonas faecalis]|uniref:TolC family protein n=1 Tax=Comamonas faecalis TaxID=1387849 RepID=UPI000C9F7054
MHDAATPSPRRSFWRTTWFAAGAWLLAAVAQAGNAPAPAPLSFSQAWLQLQQGSDQLAASERAVEGARLRREGMQGLGGPTVALTGMAYRYKAQVDIDLDPARHSLDGVIGLLPPALGGGLGGAPQLPSNYNLQRSDNRASASVSLLWPLYVGGAADAVRSGLQARTDEALADARSDALALHSLLVERYFGAQLARRAAQLRQHALALVREHDAAAQQMLEAGVASQLDRLQARAALADAEQQARQALDQAQLAATALARTVKATAPLQASSPLFVLSQPLQPLQRFQDAAQQHHPGLAKVQAKRSQAGALHDAQEALRKPQLLGFGLREVNTQGKPSWVAGVAARWTLWDSVDRDQLAAASQRSVEQAQLAEQQARSDIALLVEKHWLAVEQARRQYLAQQAQQDLAQALLKLRQAGLREGTSTTLELIEAEVNLARIGTERAQTANQYVQALAALLQACGLSEDFARYQAQADILIPTDTTITAP